MHNKIKGEVIWPVTIGKFEIHISNYFPHYLDNGNVDDSYYDDDDGNANGNISSAGVDIKRS